MPKYFRKRVGNMAETAHEKYIREQKEATERANADKERIEAERGAAQADRERIKENQGEREGGPGPND